MSSFESFLRSEVRCKLMIGFCSGPCFIFVRMALCLTEDFGLHLGSHRFNSMGAGVTVRQEHLDARRNLFWTAFASDVIASMCKRSSPSSLVRFVADELFLQTSDDHSVSHLTRSTLSFLESSLKRNSKECRIDLQTFTGLHDSSSLGARS